MKHRWFTVGAAVAGSAIAYHRLVRPWQERWGTTDDEVVARLPGDELVDEPAGQVTRAVTINARPQEVWPWLVQIGADRGGFYSYDWLENLFGLGIHSADRIEQSWQQRVPGELVFADAKGSGGWYVMLSRPNRALVMKLANPIAACPARRSEQGWEFLWSFILHDVGDGTTRLLVRERVAFDNPVLQIAMAPIGFVSFVMTRKMMLGIKARAEAAAAVVVDLTDARADGLRVGDPVAIG